MEALELLWQKVVALMTYDSSSPLIFSSGLFLFLFVGFLLLYRLPQFFRRRSVSASRLRDIGRCIRFCHLCVRHVAREDR